MKRLLLLAIVPVFVFGKMATKHTCKAKPTQGAAKVAKGDKVTVDYTGWLFNGGKKGTQFDTSVGKAPFSFTIGNGMVIKGWDEGLLGMAEGQECTLTIPPKEGYGERGAGGVIPPNATLQFDVKIVKVEKAGKS